MRGFDLGDCVQSSSEGNLALSADYWKPRTATSDHDGAPLTQQAGQVLLDRFQVGFLAAGEQPAAGGSRPRAEYDLEASFNAERAMAARLRLLEANEEGSTRGIGSDMVEAAKIAAAARYLKQVLDMPDDASATDRNRAVRNFGGAMIDAFRDVVGNTHGDHTALAVNIELMRRSLNEQQVALNSPLRFGRVQIAIDEDGITRFTLPIVNASNGQSAGSFGFPPVSVNRRRPNPILNA